MTNLVAPIDCEVVFVFIAVFCCFCPGLRGIGARSSPICCEGFLDMSTRKWIVIVLWDTRMTHIIFTVL